MWGNFAYVIVFLGTYPESALAPFHKVRRVLTVWKRLPIEVIGHWIHRVLMIVVSTGIDNGYCGGKKITMEGGLWFCFVFVFLYFFLCFFVFFFHVVFCIFLFYFFMGKGQLPFSLVIVQWYINWCSFKKKNTWQLIQLQLLSWQLIQPSAFPILWIFAKTHTGVSSPAGCLVRLTLVKLITTPGQ